MISDPEDQEESSKTKKILAIVGKKKCRCLGIPLIKKCLFEDPITLQDGNRLNKPDGW